MRRKNLGFSLVELVTSMLIVGILTAIAIPSYRSYVIRANRTDAKTALLSTAGALERCYTRANTYVGCALTLPLTVSTNTYRIEVDTTPPAPTPAGIKQDTFAIRAVPLGAQVKDTACATFTLNGANQRGVTGTKMATPAECWGK